MCARISASAARQNMYTIKVRFLNFPTLLWAEARFPRVQQRVRPCGEPQPIPLITEMLFDYLIVDAAQNRADLAQSEDWKKLLKNGGVRLNRIP